MVLHYYQALKEGNLALVQHFLKEGCSVNHDFGGYFPLNVVINRHVTHESDLIVEELIKAGAKVNMKTSSDETPLFQAVDCRDYRAVESLIRAGADINAVCGNETPLARAVFNEDVPNVLILLSHGAEVNKIPAVCKKFTSKKHSFRSVFIVEQLVRAGIRLDDVMTQISSPEYRRVLHRFATEKNFTESKKYIHSFWKKTPPVFSVEGKKSILNNCREEEKSDVEFFFKSFYLLSPEEFKYTMKKMTEIQEKPSKELGPKVASVLSFYRSLEFRSNFNAQSKAKEMIRLFSHQKTRE